MAGVYAPSNYCVKNIRHDQSIETLATDDWQILTWNGVSFVGLELVSIFYFLPTFPMEMLSFTSRLLAGVKMLASFSTTTRHVISSNHNRTGVLAATRFFLRR